jgi:hypothetical protein
MLEIIFLQLHAKDLMDAVQNMYDQKKYKEV